MSTLIKVFSVGFTLVFILVFLTSMLFYSFHKSLLLGLILGILYGFFAMGFMIRKLKRVTFIINASNKKNDKGLNWYQEKIEHQAFDMRFKEVVRSSNKIIYRASTLYRVFESDIVIELSPYDVSITCSRMMMRIILDYLDLKYEDEHVD